MGKKQINYFDTPEYKRKKGEFMANFMNWVIKQKENEVQQQGDMHDMSAQNSRNTIPNIPSI